jgi:hypothetical protein
LALWLAAVPVHANWVVEAQDPAACVTRAHGQIDIDSGLHHLWYSCALDRPHDDQL